MSLFFWPTEAVKRRNARRSMLARSLFDSESAPSYATSDNRKLKLVHSDGLCADLKKRVQELKG